MDIKDIKDAKKWFQVLQTGKQSQTAIMTLKPGQASGDEPEAHQNSEQVLLVLDGELQAEIGSQRKTMRQGEVIVIPPGVKHKFTNQARSDTVTFNVYSPPEY